MKVLKIISRVASVLIILALILSATLAISSQLSKGTPKFFGKTMMLVLSGSMEPSIKTGSAIFVEDVKNPEELKKGDVITFRSPIQNEKIITHRIEEVKGSTGNLQFITKGDNNEVIDTLPIPESNILGKYTEITIPYLGYIASFLQSKKGIGLALIIPGLLIMALEIFSVWRTLVKYEKVKQESVA
ncbi:signal peptidase I [Fictibacillus sp. NPDC058756]|uniref:signal peptidase I n=1 Tax=Fictibacillus sp. NPDC058756 TaxID=3346625 RepID=UPI0036A9000F